HRACRKPNEAESLNPSTDLKEYLLLISLGMLFFLLVWVAGTCALRIATRKGEGRRDPVEARAEGGGEGMAPSVDRPWNDRVGRLNREAGNVPSGSGSGLVRRCFECRSRGEKGDCRDPFLFNLTSLLGAGAEGDKATGISTSPCASGWCEKILEGGQGTDDFDQATHRRCLLRGPPDGQERCAQAIKEGRKVFTCFCHGDLCNHAVHISLSSHLLFLLIPLALLHF
ncbi:unnamed protein product, partial [Darwinula stevensoni]